MPDNPNAPVVKYGDVTQRVGVEVIAARGVDVPKRTSDHWWRTKEKKKPGSQVFVPGLVG